MKKLILSSTGLALLLLAGCGTSNGAPGSSTQNATNISSQSATLKSQEVDLTVLPGAHLGPDGKNHDTFSPSDFTVAEGVPVKLNVYNYDSGTHTVSNSDLGLNLQVQGSTSKGVPKVSAVTFTPTKTGDFTWKCLDKCDGGMESYAMTHPGYMTGTIHVVPAKNQQSITLTIKDGLKYAADDSKLHDSFSFTDFTLQEGVPVHMSVINYDPNPHDVTSEDLGVSQDVPGANKVGDPSITNFTFTPDKAGDISWDCETSCDGGMSSFGMTHQGYMMGTMHIVP
jgi:plastocyanin domain-containing protein